MQTRKQILGMEIVRTVKAKRVRMRMIQMAKMTVYMNYKRSCYTTL